MKPVIINAQYYKEAMAFVPTSQSRYALNCIHIEPHPEKGVLIVATDGHRLGIFRDINGECAEAVTVNAYRPALDFIDQQSAVVRITEDLEIVPAQRVNGVVECGPAIVVFPGVALSKQSFPNWRATVPQEAPVGRLACSGNYLSSCALDALNGNVRIWHKPEGKHQMIVRAAGRDDFVAIVMPLTNDSTDTAYPDFLVPSLRGYK